MSESQRLPPLMDPPEFAALLRVHPNTVAKWLREGRSPVRAIRVGDRYKFRRSEVERWLLGDWDNDNDAQRYAQ